MEIAIETTEPLSQLELLEIHARCREGFQYCPVITPGPRSFGMDTQFTGLMVDSVALALAGISLCLQILQIRKLNDREAWTHERLKREIGTECARLGIVNFTIDTIQGFENLLNLSDAPCKVILRAGDGRLWAVYILHDGERFSIRIPSEFDATI